jgi:hypothetical protein
VTAVAGLVFSARAPRLARQPIAEENWYGYRDPVLAVRGGTVVAVKDGIAENVPPSPNRSVPIDLEEVGGIHAGGRTGSSFPRWDRNLNTGGRNYDETTWLKARNAVHHSREYPSRLIL